MDGLDYAWTHPAPAAIRAAGIGFAARYLSRDAAKALTATEVLALQAEGLFIVVVWEDAAQAALGGSAQGGADATEANRQAVACGLAGTLIYFAADWDATPAQQDAIDAYLDGAASVIGRDRVGLYGGYWPLSRARAAGKASRYWGTPAWSGSNWATCGWQPDIMQGAAASIGGVSVDLDTSLSDDFGQWPRPAPAKGAGMIITTAPPGNWVGPVIAIGNGTNGKPWTSVWNGETWSKPGEVA